MPDLSIPEIVKQFNERQSQKNKPKRRPHSSSVYTVKRSARKNESSNEKPSYDYNAFITGKNKSLVTVHNQEFRECLLAMCHLVILVLTDFTKDTYLYKKKGKYIAVNC